MNKKYIWCFMGQVHAQGARTEMINSLKQTGGEYYCNVNSSWQSEDSLSTQDYKKILEQSIFVPCPRGNSSPDTFRLYEAIEAGSIPIVERDEYWSNLFGNDHPLIEVSDWSKAAHDITTLSKEVDWQEKYRLKLASWWREYKNKISSTINSINKELNSDIRHSKEKFADNVSAEIKIPRRIFQTWETCDLGPVFNKLSNQVKAMNSGYEYHLFDAEQRRLFIEKNFAKDVLDCYDRIIPGAFKADLWRCCVLYKLGGIYCDIDMLAANSFDSLIEGDIDFFVPIDFARKNRENILFNSVFGCTPGCEIVKNCINIIVDHVQNETWHKNQTEDIIYDYLNFAGPAVLGRAVNRFLDRDENTSFGKNYGIIEHKNKRIKLIEFSDRDEYIKDAHGKVIVQNKNGNEKLKCMIDEEMPSYGLKHWGEQLGLDRKPYISDAVKINPTAVRHHGIEYVLYRTESYPQNGPAYYRASSGKKINFYRSNAGYQLKIGESKTIDCTFDFGDYSYVKSKMIDLAGTSRMKIEDIRFVENTIESNNGELSCLACCTILSYIDVFEGQKKEDGSWDEKKPIGLKLKTSPGICRVNLNTAEIQYIRTLTNQSDDIQKNWLMFKHDDLYYCLYSMFPLIYRCAKSIDDIEFSDQEKAIHPKLHNATCPIQISDNRYAMICHSERFTADGLPWAYKKYIVTFDIINQKISNVFSKELDINKEYYCSSIIKEDDKIRVFAGIEDIDNTSFLIDIPQDKNLKTKQKQFLHLKNKWQDFIDDERLGKYRNLHEWVGFISSTIKTTPPPKEKFSTYNPGKKIAIVSLYTPEISDFATCSEKSIREYCELQGYTFYIYREKLDVDANANWSKAKCLLNHIEDHEHIIWMDSDTLIFNPQKRFEEIISKLSSTKKIAACQDIGSNNTKMSKGSMLNSGVLIFCNHPYSINILKKWLNFNGDKSSLYSSGGDQEILCEILKKSDGFGYNRKIFPMNEFNTDPRLVDKDTFIIHFMAYPNELKKIFMNYFVS